MFLTTSIIHCIYPTHKIFKICSCAFNYLILFKVDLLDEAVKRMYEILKERVETGKSPLSLDKVSEG